MLRCLSFVLIALTQLWAAPARAGLELEYVHVLSFGTQGAEPGQFQYVEDFAFGKDGALIVTDASHAWVQLFDKSTGRFLNRFGGKGDDDHQLEKPEGVAVDPNGNVYIADYNTGYIKKYATPGRAGMMATTISQP